MVIERTFEFLYDISAFIMNIHDNFSAALAYQSREEPEHLYVLAGKYWRIMLIIEIVLFCIAAAVGAYLLVMTFFSFGAAKTPDAHPKSLNKALLSKTVQGFEARADLFQELRSGAASAPDPSR